jgi:hypothetical protein
MTAITIAITAIVVSAFTMIANSFAGMVTAEPVAVPVTANAAGVI